MTHVQAAVLQKLAQGWELIEETKCFQFWLMPPHDSTDSRQVVRRETIRRLRLDRYLNDLWITEKGFAALEQYNNLH